MADKKKYLPKDDDNQPIQIMALDNSQDVDGTSASAQSTAINAGVVRIVAVDADIRFLIGADPTALATSHFLSQGADMYLPITEGHKVAVLGGKANIAECGVD